MFNPFKKIQNLWTRENLLNEKSIEKDVKLVMEKLIAQVIDLDGQIDLQSVLESRKNPQSLNQLYEMFNDEADPIDNRNNQSLRTPRHAKKKSIQTRREGPKLHMAEVISHQATKLQTAELKLREHHQDMEENDQNSNERNSEDMIFDSQGMLNTIDPKRQSMSEGVYIDFTVFMFQDLIKYNYKPSISFMFDERDKHTSFALSKENNVEVINGYVKLTITAFMPFFILRAKKRISYYYYLVDTDASNYGMDDSENNARHEIQENLLVELKRLRQIDSSLLNSIETDVNRSERYIRYDGFALFTDEHSYSRANQKRLKQDVLNNLVNIHVLRDEKYREYCTEFIQSIMRVHECLCLDDDEYKNKFDQILVEKFNFLQRRFDVYDKEKKDWEYLTVMIMFTFSVNFDLFQKMPPKPWLNYIFKYLDSKQVLNIENVKKSFSYNLKYLVQALETFLIKNMKEYKLPFGINALLILYKINGSIGDRKKRQKKDYSLSEKDLSQYLKYTCDCYPNELNVILRNFCQVVKKDPDFGALLMNYFGYNNRTSMESIFNYQGYNSDSFMHYISILIAQNENVKGQKLVNTQLENLINGCLHFKSLNLGCVSEELNQALILLKCLLKCIPNEFEIMKHLVNIILFLFHHIEANLRNAYNQHEISDLQRTFEGFFQILSDYSSAYTSVLFSFGIPFDKVLTSNQAFMNFLPKDLNHKVTNDSERRFYQALLSSDFPDRKYGNHSKVKVFKDQFFHNHVKQMLSARLAESNFSHLLLVRTSSDFLESCPALDKQLEHTILEKLYSVDFIKNIEILATCLYQDPKKLQFYTDQLMLRVWPKDNKRDLLKFMAESNYFLKIIEYCFNCPILSNQWRDKFKHGIQLLVSSINGVMSGEETTGIIKLMEPNTAIYSHIIQLLLVKSPDMVKDLKVDLDKLKVLFAFRRKEVARFEHYSQSIKAFLQFSALFKQHIKTDKYGKRIAEIDSFNRDKFPLNTVCRRMLIENMITSSDYFVPDINFFEGINHEDIVTIDRMNNLERLKCVLFDIHFNEACQEVKKQKRVESLVVKHVISDVFPLTVKKWRVIADVIDRGSIKLVEIDQGLNNYFSGNFKKYYEELKYICGYFQIGKFKERMIQIDRYNKFRSITEAAESIEKIRQALGLKNKFKELHILLNVKSEQFNDWTILRMDDEVERTIQVLKKMDSPQKLECLTSFVKSMDFVKWLRSNTKNIKELKFLVDLASSGDKTSTNNDLLAKVLLEAGVAFTPLIFDLNVNTNFHEFMDQCDIVWSYLDRDKNICEKMLYFDKDKIEILENIRQQSGNVEMSSINKAKQFNLNGVYTVGLSRTHTGIDLAASACISHLIGFEANLLKTDGRQEKKICTYEEMKELQNILLLVAKKDDVENDEKDLEYFIEVFNSIVRLTDIHLKLLSSGCDLFESLVTHVYCDIFDTRIKNGKPILSITYDSKYSPQVAAQIKSHVTNSTDSTNVCLKNVCVFMESCFELWQRHLVSIRNMYTYINYFNTNQIIYLRRNLSKLFFLDHMNRENSELDLEMISFLLHDICPEITDTDRLVNFYRQSLEKGPRSASIDASSRLKQPPSRIFDNRINQLIDQIATENNFRRSVIKRAVDIYGTLDKDAIVDYCLENDMLDEEDTEDVQLHRHNDDECELMDSQESPINNSINVNNASFSKHIQILWTSFLEKQNGFSKSFLTIEHLAQFLELIHEKKNDFQRTVPGYLTNKGNPNLIICPLKDQILTTLSIYAHSFGQPLPSSDEILFCSKDTTSEEVENFFRIAFKSDGKRIYTLMNVQELAYIEAEKIELFLTGNNHVNHTSNYNLVCICSQESHTTSIIATALLRFRVQTIPLADQQIEEYLASKLTVKGDRNGLPSQDFQKSSVRILLSKKPGNGKSMYVNRIRRKINKYHCIRIKDTCLNKDKELQKLLDLRKQSSKLEPALYHIDIAFEVFHNVDYFLFNLIIIGAVKHSNGLVWRRNNTQDLYMIEIMPPFLNRAQGSIAYHSILNYLPRILFRTPREYFYDLMNLSEQTLTTLQDNAFESFYREIQFQRCSFYIKILRETPNDLARFDYQRRVGLGFPAELAQAECLKVLLEYSELQSPNWSELSNFVNFLDGQLAVLERTLFIKEIPEFKTVFSNLIIMMSYDFGLPSLNIGEESSAFTVTEHNQVQISMNRLEVARRWENMAHPYIIFNADGVTFTFMGIYLDRKNYKFKNPNRPNEFIELPELQLKPNLRIALLKQRVPIFENFNDFPRTRKINDLRNVMGLNQTDQISLDPDVNYQLTMDNCLKLMAIFMRLRCGNPVVIMGETGCGKTRKVKFLSDLHLRSKKVMQLKHLIHVKIHGGTTSEEIAKKVVQAESLARHNNPKLYTAKHSKLRAEEQPASAILFFDEANTTEAIGLIKEILCDRTCNGREIDFSYGLKIIAAVNPYRKHSDEMIAKLEEAGLGFFMSASDTNERIGHIPMRQLVYRVQPLPAAMLPLVWDFGQLDPNAEKIYIRQFLNQRLKETSRERVISRDILITEADINAIDTLLSKSQEFMRAQMDECSFVSLRDIERVIKVSEWFLEKNKLIFGRMRAKRLAGFDDSYQESEQMTLIQKSVVLALCVCYHSALKSKETRQAYRKLLTKTLPFDDYQVTEFPANDWVLCEILKCQHLFLDEIKLKDNIARNNALLENVYMMIICIELRIPLFIVGKPGSSKSLAKTIVSSLMEGKNSKSELFKNLKETYFVNFQCSPLTTPEMIVNSFKEAARYQEGMDLEKSVSVVNLDEIGLAEGSESMPLKTLHPLLEEGTDSDVVALPHQKVAMIGISNWSLDPAKMNRGILLSRGEPDIDELIETAKGICKYDQHIFNCIEPHIKDIAESYLEVCKIARQFKREFFGLRDFYSLVKMLYWFCTKDGNFTWNKLEHAVKRNFSGLSIDPVEPFRTALYSKLDTRQLESDPKSSPIDLIKAALHGENVESNNRYLLFLSQNYSLVDMIQSYICNVLKVPAHMLVTVFGSGFRHDQEYTEIVRNISRVKQGMELGKTVILLNCYNLHESLYDVMNQYYQEFAGQRYVNLGLGTHKVNSLVHENFRLIVIAEKEAVYDTNLFPIPLLSRLEKCPLNAIDLLTSQKQKDLLVKLNKWVDLLCSQSTTGNRQGFKTAPNEVFIGLNEDTIAMLVLNLTQKEFSLVGDELSESMITELAENEAESDFDENTVLKKIKEMILKCATADGIIRQSNSQLSNQMKEEQLWEEYFKNHSSLRSLIKNHIENKWDMLMKNLIQITTNSKNFMSSQDITKLVTYLNVKDKTYCLLQSFETKQQFTTQIKAFLNKQWADDQIRLLMIHCNFNQKNSGEIETARHIIVEQIKETPLLTNSFILLFINLTRENLRYFNGFQIAYWTCYHIDELDETSDFLPSFDLLKGNAISRLLQTSLEEFRDELVDSKSINLQILLKKIIHTGCSLIVDTNIDRTIYRIELFLKLCNTPEFVYSITNRLIQLQKEKEADFMHGDQCQNWLIKEVSDLKIIQQHSSLKRSCQSYFESKLSPLLAYILAYIDYFSNIDIFYDSIQSGSGKPSWITDLWLSIFNSGDVCKIAYDNLRSKQNDDVSVELTQFLCKSDPLKRKFNEAYQEKFVPKLPFVWILINQLNELNASFMESARNVFPTKQGARREADGTMSNNYVCKIPGLFEKTKIYELIEDVFRRHGMSLKHKETSKMFLDLYINDFLLLNCNIQRKKDLEFLSQVTKSMLDGLNLDSHNLNLLLPTVHFEFEKVREKISIYLKFSAFEPKLVDQIQAKCNYNEIDLEACLATIKIFEQSTQKTDVIQSLHRLRKLTQLVKTTLSKIKNDRAPGYESNSNPRYNLAQNKFEFLQINYQFMDNVLLQAYRHRSEDILAMTCQLANILKIKYLTRNIQPDRECLIFDRKIFDNIHEFLVKCVLKAKELLFNTNTVSKCCGRKCQNYKLIQRAANCDCEKCIVCEECEIKMISILNKSKTVCPICRKNIHILSDTFSIDLEELEINKESYNQFLVNLNKFYSNIIEFVFLKDKTADDSSIQSVLRVLTDGAIRCVIDGNHCSLPIYSNFKAIILKTLFENYSHLVQFHFNHWFDKCITTSTQAKESANFFQLCVYDQHLHQLISQTDDVTLRFGSDLCKELVSQKMRIKLLFEQPKSQYKVDYLFLIGKLKCCMEIMAYFCNSQDNLAKLSDPAEFENFNFRMKAVFEEVKQDTLYNYLIKILIRRYGSSSIKNVLGNENTRWITPNRIIGNNTKVNDRYVLIGPEYTKIKALITESFQTMNASNFENYIISHSNVNNVSVLFPYLCMALYQSITLLYREMPNVPYDKFVPVLNNQLSKQKHHWKPLVENTLPHKLIVNEVTWKDVELNMLLIQLKFSILFTNSKLIKPLTDLITNPIVHKTSYIPTMPQDSIYDIQHALVAGNQGDTPKFYECPKGHPYVLFDCGRPWVIHTCKSCGAQIGGSNHKLLEDNKQIDVRDKTLRGYCLKDASMFKEEPMTERELSSTQFSLVRFFVHACMYFSCDNSEKDLHSIMTDPVLDKRQFFWDHLNLDLKITCKTLNVNKDEILLLLHTVCTDILKSHNNSKPHGWNSKDDRQQWEKTFSEMFLKNILKEPNMVIAKANEELAKEKNDEGDQSQKVYFMAYERIKDKEKQFMYENSEFWKYAPHVSFRMMGIELLNTTQIEEYAILKKLIAMKDKLALVRHLPSMVKFINLLQETYSKRLFKHYANKSSIRDILLSKDEDKLKIDSDWFQQENQKIVRSFQEVWQSAKLYLAEYIRENIKVAESSVFDLSFEFNLDTNLSLYLPSLHGDGLIVYSMIHYLSSIQNEMLLFYYKKKSIEYETLDIKQFDIMDNIISFSENNDLLRIIQTNFAFEPEKEKKIFHYDRITDQISDRYFQSKPVVNIENMFLFEYAGEINDNTVFARLSDIITQENLELPIQVEVFFDFKNINEISEAMNITKTLINYGKATSANPDLSLSLFIRKIYSESSIKDIEQILKSNTMDRCYMKNLKHISVILMMKKALLYTLENQDPFEDLHGLFKSQDKIDLLIPMNQVFVTSFTSVIFQMVTFQLHSLTDEEFACYSEYKITEMLSTLDCNTDILVPENLSDIIESVSPDLRLRNLYEIWKLLADFMSKLDKNTKD